MQEISSLKKVLWVMMFGLVLNTSANDSLYRSVNLSECQVLEEDERSITYSCPSPEGIIFRIFDAGGPMLQLSIEKGNETYEFFSSKEPNCVEWRTNTQNHTIGMIVRVFDYVDTVDMLNSKLDSRLYVISLINNPTMLQSTTSNEEAREIIDNYASQIEK